MTSEAAPDWEALGRRFSALRGREYWRSLDELADTPEFRSWLARELPRPLAPLEGSLDRREFVALIGAALALAGLSGCGRPPAEKIVPTARPSGGVAPGKPLFYATAMPHPGGATGLLVRSDQGRPTKVEGNPRHPASLGATDVFAQAAIYGLWDPDRSSCVTRGGLPSTREAFLEELAPRLAAARGRRGAGLALLTEEILSPTAAAQLVRLLGALPEARIYSHDPLGRAGVKAGMRLAFGKDLEPVYRLDRADVVLCLDADLLSVGPGRERYTRDFTERRRGGAARNRLYVVESSPTPTGAAADHRWPLRSCDAQGLTRSLAKAAGLNLEAPEGPSWIQAVARDLLAHAGRSVVIAGRDQPPPVQALAAALNEHLGNVGKTVGYLDPAPFDPEGTLADLSEDLAARRVDTLLILGGNPVYTAPAELDFARRLAAAPFRAHLGLYADETARQCLWHLPESHFLEQWSDTLAYDGTASLIQPLIAPLYGGLSLHELLSVLEGKPGVSPYDAVRSHWKGQAGVRDFEEFWSTALHDGLIQGTARAPRTPSPRMDRILTAVAPEAPAEVLELVFRPDPTVADGRFANNAWLQELPKPLSSLTWENAALMGPAQAARLKLAQGDEVELSLRGKQVAAPVCIVPGHADRSVTVTLGYGRTQSGRVGTGRGFDAYRLQPSNAASFATGLAVRKTGRHVQLATTQLHHSMEGRDLVRSDAPPPERLPSLYPEYPSSEYAWGMSIDLSACTQCNACVLACQVENNVPVVGKEQVLAGREMHWLRIDTYFEGHPDRPKMLAQPVPCMHCEKAPCELVCPVNATSHSREGLNQMTYNRCVGTRYCSNNCPYKVRRFNFLQYSDFTTPAAQERYNPQVSVRERGVMEKCTYCVQRITRARIDAEKEGRRIRDGEVRTACQQVCPSRAIVFGDLSDPASEVSRQKANPLDYALLGELGTRPRTTYLAKRRNPNPEIEEA